MTDIDIENIDAKDLFKVDIEIRKRIIESGVEVLLNNAIQTSKTTNMKLSKVLNDTLAAIEFHLEMYKEDENYELCYYMTELQFGLLKRINHAQQI